MLPDPSSTNLIIGGDFNCYLDAYLDRSSTQVTHILRSVITLNNLCKSFNLVDIWRLQHPSNRDYSFSRVHKSYSRIDYFLIDSKLISNVTQTKYNNIIISDHSPLTMVFKLSVSKMLNWRLNPCLFLQEQFHSYISSHIKQFLEFNDKGDVSDYILWETFKVVLRGNIIAYESSRKEKRGRLAEIETLLPTLENAYRLSKSQSDLNVMLKLKYEYNNILSEQVSNIMLKIKCKQFEMVDKPERLLSRQLRGIQANRAISELNQTQVCY